MFSLLNWKGEGWQFFKQCWYCKPSVQTDVFEDDLPESQPGSSCDSIARSPLNWRFCRKPVGMGGGAEKGAGIVNHVQVHTRHSGLNKIIN